MRNHIIFAALLLLFSTTANTQIVNRFRDSTIFYNKVQFDSIIRITEGAGNGKVLTSDGNGVATWQVNTAIDIAGPPTQVLYFANDSTTTSSALFTRTDTSTIIINAFGDTSCIAVVGKNVDGSGMLVSGNILTDNNTFLFVNALTSNGNLVGDLLQDPYYLPVTDGMNGQYIVTDGAGNLSFDSIALPVSAVSNGLVLSGSTAKLGGSLTASTQINQLGYNLQLINGKFSTDIPLNDGSGFMSIRNDTSTGALLGYNRNSPFGGAYFEVYPFDSTGTSDIRWIAECRSLYDSTHRYGISGYDDNVNVFQYNPNNDLDVAQINIKLHKINLWTHDIGGHGGLVQVDTNYLFFSPRISNNDTTRSGNVWYYADSTGHEFNGQFQLVNGTQGAGKVLSSDASGNSSWSASSTTSADSATIYALTPTAGTMYYCNNCTGGGITGRIVAYIGSAWRRLQFD